MPNAFVPELIMPYLVVIVTIGNAAAFVSAGRRGPSSRLCDAAAAGESLLDEGLGAESPHAEPAGTLHLKGLSAPAPVFRQHARLVASI